MRQKFQPSPYALLSRINKQFTFSYTTQFFLNLIRCNKSSIHTKTYLLKQSFTKVLLRFSLKSNRLFLPTSLRVIERLYSKERIILFDMIIVSKLTSTPTQLRSQFKHFLPKKNNVFFFQTDQTTLSPSQRGPPPTTPRKSD